MGQCLIQATIYRQWYYERKIQYMQHENLIRERSAFSRLDDCSAQYIDDWAEELGAEMVENEMMAQEEDYAIEVDIAKGAEEFKRESECILLEAELARRQKQAGEETAAIEKAKEVLAEGVKVFLQTSTKLRVKSADEAYDTRAQVVRVLSKISQKAHSYKLMQLVASARSDPFGKIRGLIEDMIAKLTKEAAEEADQKSFCDEEISESKAKQADLTGKLDKTSARIAKADADKAKLLEEIKTLEAEVAEIDASQAEATKMREEAHSEYVKASTDFKDSAAAVAKAIGVRG